MTIFTKYRCNASFLIIRVCVALSERSFSVLKIIKLFEVTYEPRMFKDIAIISIEDVSKNL